MSAQSSQWQLNKDVEVQNGAEKISLSRGTLVNILHQGDVKATISIERQDGSSLITQVSNNDLEPSSSPNVAQIQKPVQSQSNLDSGNSTVKSDSGAAGTALVDQAPSPPQEDTISSPPEKKTEDRIVTMVAPLISSSDPLLNNAPKLDAKYHVYQGTISEKTSLRADGTITFVYRIPLDSAGRPAPSASNMVFYAPYLFESNLFTRDFHLYLTDKVGCSLFSVLLPPDLKDKGKTDPAFWEPEPEWSTLIFKIQDQLISQYNLEPRKLILTGESIGSLMAQRIAAAHPDKVDAVAIVGGHDYDSITGTTPPAWLILNTIGDSGDDDNDQLASQLRLNNASVVRLATPQDYAKRPNYHSPGPEALQIIDYFIEGFINSRNNPEQAPPATWPFRLDSDSSRILRNQLKSGFSLSVNDAAFIPSVNCAYAIQMLPTKARKISISDTESALMSITPWEHPKGVILYSQAYEILSYPRLLDDMIYLSQQGFDVIAPKCTSTTLDSTTIQETCDWVSRDSNLQKLPLFVFGRGFHGETLLSWSQSDGHSPIKAMVLDELSLRSALSDDAQAPGYPLLFLYAESDSRRVLFAGSIESVKGYVSGLKDKQSNVSVSILPDGQPSSYLQNSIMAASDFFSMYSKPIK